jgi:RES domain-containing protein
VTLFPPQLLAPLRAWRVDQARHRATWDSGTGAYAAGGRWNPKGVKAVYCSLDAATAIIEVAVHKGFRVLDTVPHVSTVLEITAPGDVHVVLPGDVPNPSWLLAGIPGAGQQAFGAGLLATHRFVAIPSAASRQSWNLVFDPDRARGRYALLAQDALAIDTRLNPAGP